MNPEEVFVIGNFNPGQPRDKYGKWTKGAGFGSNPSGEKDYKAGSTVYRTAEAGYFQKTFNRASIANAILDANEPVTKKLVKAIRNGEQIDWIVTYPDLDGRKVVADGHHRLSAFMIENKVPHTLNFPDRTSAWDHINKKENKMNRLERLNNLEEKWINAISHYNPAQPRDKLGRWCSMGVWINFSESTGLGNPYEVSDTNKGMTKASIVGVAGDSIPEKVPRIKGLSKEQKQIESEFAKNWDDPKQREKALNEIGQMEPFNKGTVETDAIKQLDPKWGKDSRIKEIQKAIEKGEASKEMVNELAGYMKYRQENNTILHQTANVLAKEYFKRQVEANPKAEILVTSGGCGSGKGYFLESTDAIGRKADRPWGQIEIKDKTNGFAKKHIDSVLGNKNTITWDAAGDQNSTELNWLASFDKKMTVVHTVGDPAKNAAAKGSGLTDRALTKGRMVDATVYAHSYTIGNQNTNNFYKANADNPKITFLKVENGGRGGDVIVMAFTDSSKYDKVSLSPAQATKIIDKGLSGLTNVPESTKASIAAGAKFVESLQR